MIWIVSHHAKLIGYERSSWNASTLSWNAWSQGMVNTSGTYQSLGNCTHCSITNHTKSISSELYFMHVKRSWTCLWLRTRNEKAHTRALGCLLPVPPLITAYVTSWPPHALIRLLYARRVRTLPLPVHTHSLTLCLRLWIVRRVSVEVKLRVLLVLTKAVKALSFSFCCALLCIVSTFTSGLTWVHVHAGRRISIKYDHQQRVRLNIWALCSVCILSLAGKTQQRFCLSPPQLCQLVICEGWLWQFLPGLLPPCKSSMWDLSAFSRLLVDWFKA